MSICRCGPVSHLWCMRFEAKHSYFKSMAQRVKNFRIIPKTLANRHQRLMCYYLQHPDGAPLSKVTKSGKGVNSYIMNSCMYNSVQLL